MIKVKIKNKIDIYGQVTEDGCVRLPMMDHDVEIYNLICEVKPYDMSKWKDGKIYEFNTLREANEFIESCDLEFTDKSEESYTRYDWYELIIKPYVDPSEDNLIILYISYDREYRD